MRAPGKGRYRSGTSSTGCEGQRTFPNRLGGTHQRLANVLSFQVRVEREDIVCGLPLGHQGDDGRHRNPQAAQAWDAPHLPGIGRDPRELHAYHSRREGRGRPAPSAPRRSVRFSIGACVPLCANSSVRRGLSRHARIQIRSANPLRLAVAISWGFESPFRISILI